MAYDSLYTGHYRLPYFSGGQRYSARADYERFITLDRHLDSYVGIIGVGVIDGWVPLAGVGLSVTIGRGTGFINGYFSESGWDVVPHSAVAPGDTVIEASYYVDEDDVVYDKILVPATVVLPDDSECYLYAYRNSNYIQEDPYLLPDNDAPVPESSATLKPAHSAVGFAYASTRRSASSSGRVFVGLARTRSGSVVSMDISDVSRLSDLDSSIRNFAKYVLRGHRHGGKSPYDPLAVRLDVDRRDMVLTSSYDAKYEFTAQSSDRTTSELSHTHTYYADDDGNGVTVALFGQGAFHYHKIADGIVGDPVSDTGVESHIHEITLRNGDNDGWDTGDAVQVYVNGSPYSGDYTVDAAAKTITFDGGITVKDRTYEITSGDWTFTSQESSLYRFMLRASIAYYSSHSDAANIILPDPATPVSELKTQALVGEHYLASAGDTFMFVSPVADSLKIKLVSEAHVDSVSAEILTNSEVSGILPQDNILYIPASKIASGKLDPERIPLFDHMGRFLEISLPIPSRLKSVDGRMYEIPSTGMPTDTKTVYAVCDDGAGNALVSTSCGLWMIPSGGAYLFSVNGELVVTSPGDIATSLAEAVVLYTKRTGIAVVIGNVYDSQVSEAGLRVAAVGDTYLFEGARNPSTPGGIDRILLSFVPSYKLTNYGYEAVRTAADIKLGEVVVGTVPQEPAADGTEPDPLYRVAKSLHKYAVKEISLQRNIPSGYSAMANRYFAVSSSGIFWSDDVDRKWTEIDELSISGYIYSMRRHPSGLSVMASDRGLFASIGGAARGYRKLRNPVAGVDVSRIELLPDGRIVSFLGNYVSISGNYGANWTTVNLGSDIVEVRVDTSLDVTSTDSGHSHTVSVDGAMDGWTSYDDGHSHDIIAGVVSESDGHTHDFLRTMVVFCADGKVFSSTGSGWTHVATAQPLSSSWTCLFAAYGKIFISTADSVSVYNGTWSTDRTISPRISSATWSFDNTYVYLGYDNAISRFDGTSVVPFASFAGGSPTSFSIDGIPALRSYVSYDAPSVDFGGRILLGNDVDAIYDRSSYRPEQGGWRDGVGYDLYISDRLARSTRSGVDRTTGYVRVDNVGSIEFSVTGKTTGDLLTGQTKLDIDADMAGSLPDSGSLRIWYAKSELTVTVFLPYTSKGVSSVFLETQSPYYIPSGASVALVPQVSAGDDIRITVYDGKLTNVGAMTHYEVEDALERKSIGLDKRLADVYLSNLLHLSVAADYAFPGVYGDFINTFVSRFDYNDIPGDPNNIDRFIDRTSSDLASLAIYGVDNPSSSSSRISRVISGFGVFSGICLSASDSGLYYLDYQSLESNWIRVSAFESAYDVLQFDAGTVYVAAADGLYVTTDPSLLAWTLVNPDSVGGVPTVLFARWGTIQSDDGTSYWWNKWNGSVHENPDLVNTIIVGGDGFVSFSDDKGITWRNGDLYSSSGSLLEEMTPSSFSLLANGSAAMCARSLSGDRYGVYVSTGTGRKWTEILSSTQVEGVALSLSVTDRLNTIVRVAPGGRVYPDGSLVGREIVIGNESARIVANTQDTITAFGSDLVAEGGNSFIIRPLRINAVLEDRQRRLHVATSNGMLWDAGGLFSGDRGRDGRITSIGNVATIASVDITGQADFAVPTPSPDATPRYRFSARLNNRVSSGEMSGWTIHFQADIPELKVVSNTASRLDMSVEFIVSGSASGVSPGYLFTARGEAHRLYVSYPGGVTSGSLDGGYLVAAPDESEYGLARSEITVFRIERNTATYIQLSSDTKMPDGYQFESIFTVGKNVYCTDSDGNIPMAVSFDVPVSKNGLSGNRMEFPGGEFVPDLGKVDVLSNDEMTVVVRESYTGISPDGSTETFSVFNTLYAGLDFSLAETSFAHLPSFAGRTSSWHSGHRHAVEWISGPVTGTITALASSTATTVSLSVSGAWQLSVSWVLSAPELFSGAELVAYNPSYPLLRHRLKVVSHGASTITVGREDSKIDMDGGNSMLAGPGWVIYMSTDGYGVTTDTEYGSDFICTTSLLTENSLMGSESVTVLDPTGIVVGGGIAVKSNRIMHNCTVTNVSGNEISIAPPLQYDFLTDNAAVVVVYAFREEVSQTYLTASVAYGDVAISVMSTASVLPGDVMDVYSRSGERYQFEVVSVSVGAIGVAPSPWMFETGLYVSFSRSNTSWPHSHTVSAGQFSVVSSEARSAIGDDLVHGHYSSPVIAEALDVKYSSGTMYVVGSGYVIQASEDNGETWTGVIDLSESKQFSPLPTYLSGIYPISMGEIAFATSSGYYVYQSDRYSNQIGSSSSGSATADWVFDYGLQVFDNGFPVIDTQ